VEGLWPIIIFAVIAMLFGGGSKKRPRQTTGVIAGEREESAESGLMGELSRALQELKKAEREALERRAGVGGDDEPAPLQLTKRPSIQVRPATPKLRDQGATSGGTRGGELVKRKVHLPKPKPAGTPVRPKRPAFAEDPDQAFEDPTVISIEGKDYDDEAERIIAKRRAAAERGAREETSNEELSAQQAARRGDREPAQAIGGKAEHEDWHQRMMAASQQPAAAPVPRRNPLGRFATGRARDAVVLGEILGKPLSQR
jgi:hypothetical protein